MFQFNSVCGASYSLKVLLLPLLPAGLRKRSLPVNAPSHPSFLLRFGVLNWESKCFPNDIRPLQSHFDNQLHDLFPTDLS